MDENTKTEIYKNAGRTQSATKASKGFKEKLSKTLKNAFTLRNQSANKNPNAKIIRIFNAKDELQFECCGQFAHICKINKLPHAALAKSYKNNGTRIYQHFTEKAAKRSMKFKGWYAIKIE